MSGPYAGTPTGTEQDYWDRMAHETLLRRLERMRPPPLPPPPPPMAREQQIGAAQGASQADMIRIQERNEAERDERINQIRATRRRQRGTTEAELVPLSQYAEHWLVRLRNIIRSSSQAGDYAYIERLHWARAQPPDHRFDIRAFYNFDWDTRHTIYRILLPRILRYIYIGLQAFPTPMNTSEEIHSYQDYIFTELGDHILSYQR